MINDKLLKSAELLANELKLRGKILTVDPSNVLSRLNITDPNNGDVKTVANKLATVLTNEVSLYRNEFKAQLIEYINKCKTYMLDGGSERSIALNNSVMYNIVEVELPAILQDAEELKLFTTINQPDYDNVKHIRIPANKDGSNLSIDITKLNIPGSGKYINGYITDKDLSYEGMLPMYLQAMVDPHDLSGDLTKVDLLTKAYIIARYLYDNAKGTINMPVEDIAAIVYNLEGYLKNIIDKYYRFVEIDKLIAVVSNKTVYVIKDVYNSIEGEEDLVEAVLGAALKDDVTDAARYSKPYILTNKRELANIYDTYMLGARKVDPIQEYKRMKAIYLLSFNQIVDEMPEELIHYHTYGNSLELLREAVVKYLDGVRYEPTQEDIEKKAIDIIAGILFGATNYFKFLSYSSKYLNDPNKEPKDIIPYVLVELATEFLLGKLKVIEIK